MVMNRLVKTFPALDLSEHCFFKISLTFQWASLYASVYTKNRNLSDEQLLKTAQVGSLLPLAPHAV